jgi:hypothetical protein
MIIANPIYDTVFKYLMEDMEIAKGMLSVILNTEIEELHLKPQEMTSEVAINDKIPVNIYRLDFVAVIKEPNGILKKVLIELQKSKRSTNIARFRRYLGENYQKEDKVIINGIESVTQLEIITIYFLGFELEDVPTSVMKVKNCFIDITTGNQLTHEPKDKFIRLLNHESYTIQIPKLQPNEQNRVEKVLNIFSQKYKTNDIHVLNYIGDEKDPLISRMLKRLTRAIANEKLRRQMDFEDEIETELQDLESKINSFRQELGQKDQELEQKHQELEQKHQELEQKHQELEQKDQLIEELKRQLANKRNN